MSSNTVRLGGFSWGGFISADNVSNTTMGAGRLDSNIDTDNLHQDLQKKPSELILKQQNNPC